MHHIKHNAESVAVGFPCLYLVVCVGFFTKSITLLKWCIAKDINQQTSVNPIIDNTAGSKSFVLAQKLITEILPKNCNA